VGRYFSKTLKNILWVESGGCCEICGIELDPDGFHADHEIPWSKKGPTTAHNGLALCPQCNLRKSNYMLRKHQREAKVIARGIRDHTIVTKNILADVNPGGGKSVLPAVFGQELFGNTIDKICWVVPRLTLQEQGAASVQDDRLRKIIGHSFELRESTNDRNPARDTAGFVTTYQAIGQDAGNTVLDAFTKDRYLLVLDEPHHLKADSDWHKKMQPIFDKAVVRLLMTGTLTRGDRKEVAFLPYTNAGLVDLQNDEWSYISYSRTEALDDQAIIPINFTYGNGTAVWHDIKSGAVKTAALEDCEDEDASSALRSALSGDYALAMIEQALSDWDGYRKKVYQHSRCLVVAPNQHSARQYAKYIRSRGVACEIATSDEGEAAQKRIRQFKNGEIKLLVTVGMAYEGLDVKPVTHIVGLTKYRSMPWLEQMINRATRYNPEQGPWSRQEAFAYVPADRQMMAVVDLIRNEQEQAIREKKLNSTGGRDQLIDDDIVPLGSQFTGSKAEGLDDGLSTNYHEEKHVRELMDKFGISGQIATPKVLGLIKEASKFNIENFRAPEMVLTPRQREREKKDRIEKMARKRDKKLGLPFGTSNNLLYGRYKKSRNNMSEKELDSVLRFMFQNGFDDEVA